MPRPVQERYELFLPAGKAGYTKILPIAHSFDPGAAESFGVKVWSDRTASFLLSVSMQTTEHKEYPLGELSLQVFVPRGLAPRPGPGEVQ
jgi:hypothetical protein